MHVWRRSKTKVYGWEAAIAAALLFAGAALHSRSGGDVRWALAQELPKATYGLSGGMALPDSAVTPGAVDPDAIADLTGKHHLVRGIERNLCADDFRTAPIRAGIRNFPKLKKQACEEYGVAKCDGSVEGDHLVSIEIGGCPDCLTNLWPQPMDEARIKDHQVEDVLPTLVCAGTLTLAEAQKCIAEDWVACAARIRGTDDETHPRNLRRRAFGASPEDKSPADGLWRAYHRVGNANSGRFSKVSDPAKPGFLGSRGVE